MVGKINFETVRKIAAGLPGVEVSTSTRGTALTVGGKMMACPATNKSAEPNSLVVRIDMDQRTALVTDAPDSYYITDHYAGYPSVLVRLSNISQEALRDLLQASCRFVSVGTSRKRRK